jgi:N6-adenosine-specific RNA methylase IME4
MSEERRYGALLIDPPWPFRTYSHPAVIPARGVQPYRAMSLDEITALPVPDLLAKDAAVFLWWQDFLPRAPAQLANAWGLTLVRQMPIVWLKTTKDRVNLRMGLGKWTRNESEAVAILTKGRPRLVASPPRQCLFAEPRRENGRKPDELYGIIEALVAGPFCELFARQRWRGWHQIFSDEADRFPIQQEAAS